MYLPHAGAVLYGRYGIYRHCCNIVDVPLLLESDIYQCSSSQAVAAAAPFALCTFAVLLWSCAVPLMYYQLEQVKLAPEYYLLACECRLHTHFITC